MKVKNKPYLDKTTIQITSSVIEIYDRMVSRYGVTVAVSAGILLLDRLDPVEREKHIDAVNEMCKADKQFHEKADTLHKSGALKPLSEPTYGASKLSVLKLLPILDKIKGGKPLNEEDRFIVDLFQEQVGKKIKVMEDAVKAFDAKIQVNPSGVSLDAAKKALGPDEKKKKKSC